MSDETRMRLLKIFGAVDSLGYFLIVGSIVYFIIGAVVGLVHGTMLDWSLCGTVDRIAGGNFCEYRPGWSWTGGRDFVHRYINAPIPFAAIGMGLLLVGICSAIMRGIDTAPHAHTNREKD